MLATQWWIDRMVDAPKPLQEKMAFFWHGHFCSAWEKVQRTDAMMNQIGGLVPAADATVMATTPRNDPIRSAEYERSGGSRVNRSPTIAPAQMKTASTRAKRSNTSDTLPAKVFAFSHVSPPHKLSDMSGKRM